MILSGNIGQLLSTFFLRGMKSDFPGIYRGKICPVRCGEYDVIQQYHSGHSHTMSKVKYEDIFSEDGNKQKQVTQLFETLLEIRNNILNNLLMTSTGPLQSTPTLQNHSVLSAQISIT